VRPAYLPGVHPGGPRDGLDHHAFQRALVQFSRQQPGQEGLLGRGGPGEQDAQQPAPLSLGSGPDGRADLREHRVRPGQGEGLAARVPVRAAGRGQQAAERGVAHPDLPLAQFAGEERDRHRDLFRRRPAQQPGDLIDLDPAAGRQRYRL